MASYQERPHSFQEALKAARRLLGASPELVEKGSIDAEAEQLVIAAFRMTGGRQLTRMELFTRAQDRYPEAAGERLLILAGARAEGKPLQHLTGVQFFFDHEYEVGPDVLIPRPETEVLVQEALERLSSLRSGSILGLEIGLGSGAISIELLSVVPRLEMIGSELTAEAASRARSNARRILGDEGEKRLRVVRAQDPSQVWEPFVGALSGRRADILVSNPPYLAPSDPIEAEVIRHEPATALFAPLSDLIYFYRAVAMRGREFLSPEGVALMEIAPERSAEIRQVFEASGWNASIVPDLTGRDRVLIATLSSED